jgi:hypothetical protein
VAAPVRNEGLKSPSIVVTGRQRGKQDFKLIPNLNAKRGETHEPAPGFR